MSYYDVSLLAADPDFYQRVTAAYTIDTLADPGTVSAPQWAADHMWDMAAQPGFGDAYASALVGGVEAPGRDPAVISDDQILAAVQAVGVA